MYGAPARANRSDSSPVYQIDFTAVDSGKRIASTKRRIRWRFGFSNVDALNAGETGTACRGEEHDITLIWSITSGKRLVLADGQEVHYSNNRSHLFDFSWTMRGNHVLKVVAHANPPANAAQSFRQYDFFVDGMSFFNMPKVYRLGLAGSGSTQYNEPSGTLALATTTRGKGTYSNYSTQGGESRYIKKTESIAEIEAPKNADEEQAYLAEAIKNSLETPNPMSANRSLPPTREDDLLVDMMSEPGIPSASMVPGTASVHSTATPATVAFSQPTVTYNSPFDTAVSTAPSWNNFSSQNAAPPMTHTFPAPVPTSAVSAPDFNHTNATSYAAAPTNPIAPAPLGTTPIQTQTAAPTDNFSMPPAPVADSSNTPAPTADTFTMPPPPATADSLSTPAPTTDTTSTPVTTTDSTNPPPPDKTLTMNLAPTGLGANADAAFEKFANMDQLDLVSKSAKDQSRQNPFDDVVSKAPAPTLAGLKAMGGQAEKKEVMKPGAMVVAGTQQGNWGSYGVTAPATGYGQMSGVNQPMQMGYGQQQSMNYAPQGNMNATGFPNGQATNGQIPPQGQQYGYQQNYAQPQAAQGYGYGNMQTQQQQR